MQTLEALESGVRTHLRSFPATFCRTCGSIMLTEDGRKVIDFLCGAETLNSGHNNSRFKAAITDYLASNAVVHGLNIATPAKLEFMEIFNSVILQRQNLQYRSQFTGPTGANAIEAATKLSRKVSGRQNIIFSPTAIMACAWERSPSEVVAIVAKPAVSPCQAQLTRPTICKNC
ncbi:aminotransferase class III-fold pyridoxal phosphate-dependent enzyme [Bradyrhizobium sp. USDA 3315]